jgi:hypothetical protein
MTLFNNVNVFFNSYKTQESELEDSWVEKKKYPNLKFLILPT